MKNHSYFQMILLTVFGAFGVAGVLIFAFAVGGDKGANRLGPVVLWGTLDKNVFNATLARAVQLTPQLQDVTYVHKDEATYEQDISDALSQDTGPDLFIVRSDYAAKDEPKILSLTADQLNQVDFQNLFAEAANTYIGPHGIIGVPFLIDPMVLYWNRDLLSNAGYSVPPKYWEDVMDMTQKITVRDSTGAIKTATIAFGTSQNIENAKADLSLLLLQKGVAITGWGQAGALRSELASQSTVPGAIDPGVDALTFYTGFADPSRNYYSWNGAMQSARAAFAAGDTALYVGYASEFSLITAMNPNLNFALSELPQFKSNTHAVAYGRVYAFAVPRVAHNQRGAFMAAQLLDAATTTAGFANALGLTSARRDVLAEHAEGYAALFNRMAIITRTWPDPDPTKTDGLFRAMIDGVISGATTVDDAIQRGSQQMIQVITP